MLIPLHKKMIKNTDFQQSKLTMPNVTSETKHNTINKQQFIS